MYEYSSEILSVCTYLDIQGYKRERCHTATGFNSTYLVIPYTCGTLFLLDISISHLVSD